VARGGRVHCEAIMFRYKPGRTAGKQILPLLDRLSNISRRNANINLKRTEHSFQVNWGVKFKHW